MCNNWLSCCSFKICIDFDTDSSLDVIIDLFTMVGGQHNFLEACGGVIDSNTSHVISIKNAKAHLKNLKLALFEIAC